MSGSPINEPEHWRKRAEEMRTLAAGLKNGDAKNNMLRIAAEYERLAERAALRGDGQGS